MTGRFSNLTKVPAEPAAKLLAQSNVKLTTPLTSPASAPIEAVLDELAGQKANADLLRVISVVLPPRERVWWACLAARDIVGSGDANETRSLKAAEAWVFRPTEANREAAIASLDHADNDDKTTHCAMAVMYCDGTMGTGDLAKMPAPPGAAAIAAFAMNVEALSHAKDQFETYMQELVDRAVDIARGGNGKRAAAEPENA